MTDIFIPSGDTFSENGLKYTPVKCPGCGKLGWSEWTQPDIKLIKVLCGKCRDHYRKLGFKGSQMWEWQEDKNGRPVWGINYSDKGKGK